MGSPWPWNVALEPVKAATNGTSTYHNHGNNKRTSYDNSHSPYYYNHHNHEYHQNALQAQQPHHHHPHSHHHSHQNGNRFSASATLASTPGEPMISHEMVTRKRVLPANHHNHQQQQHNLHHHNQQQHHHQQQQQQNPYFNFDTNGYQHHHSPPPQPTTPPQQLNHHHHQNNNNNNNNYQSFRKMPLSPVSMSTISSATTPNHHHQHQQQSQFVTFVKEIPTWNIYFSDQKHRIIDFTDKNNSIRPDQELNQLVSLCFVDTCITHLAVDAIVNSTTSQYCGGSGVDKLIHQVAGRDLRETCKSLPRLATGQAEMTPGFSLPAKYIIHTNGPSTDENTDLLRDSYMNCLRLLLIHKLRTIAFPCISTEKGLSKKFAAEIALSTVRQFLEMEENKQKVDRVIFCLHHQKDIEIYLRYMQIYFPVGPSVDRFRMGLGRGEIYLRIDRDY